MTDGILWSGPALAESTSAGAFMLGFSTYNYERFTRDILRDHAETPFAGPEPGDRVPDFKATTLGSETVRLSDFQGRKNVLLVFGSATCPMTAASIGGINDLYDRFRGDDIEFLFVYVREAHPGERIPAHRSMRAKTGAARHLRDEDEILMPMVVDDVHGSIHKKYSRLPNPAFLIDKSGRVAFRCKWAKPDELASAIEELLEIQHERGVDHAVVNGGQDLSMPHSYAVLYSYRALERGGKESLQDFRQALGLPGQVALAASRIAEPLLGNPGRILAVCALTAAVLAGGLYAGFELRKRRLGTRRNPYRAYERQRIRDTETGTDYGAVGI
ncbi:MAG TPA: redoxin domain-containing protein [Candidatus Acidoferrales bacterium]|jgi:peroxiredoxin|nr:redoxin domain-containing protein [Candidatus Acidoferrales bacterium]